MLALCGLGVVLVLGAGCKRGASARRPGSRLVRGPYLQLLTDRSVTVVWKTDVPAACSLAIRGAGRPERIVEGAVGTTCAVAAGGLEPGGTYAYVPRADGMPVADAATFHTDDPARAFSFLVLGDSGTGGAEQSAVRDRMLATTADFILHTGDMAYPRGEAASFDPAVFQPYAGLLRRLVLWPCLGNHDARSEGGAPWRKAFYTPANNREGDEAYYSFHFGNGLFVVLDSNASTAPDSPQHRFLDEVLAADAAVWKFVALHHTLYSSGRHGPRVDVRDALVPLFDRHRVDLVLMGHDHDYERTLPLRGGKSVDPGEGTVYVTTGGGGQTLRPVGRSVFTAHAETAFHFVRVAVDGTALRLQMIRVDGTVGDDLKMKKPEGARPRASSGGS
jgi:hypothetical protein